MAVLRSREVIVGIGKLADELNVSRGSIYRTMQGTLNSARLRRELQARGLHPAPYKYKRKRKPAKQTRTKGNQQ